MDGSGITFPGERLGVEEEFTPSDNTFTESGELYASAVGVVRTSGGKIEIENGMNEIMGLGRGSTVIGTVVGALPSVIFVDIDSIKSGARHYVALKDGKLVMQRGGPREQHSRGMEFKPCGMGDLIIARIVRDDEDTYELSLNGEEEGVIFSRCEICSFPLVRGENRDVLECRRCKHKEGRKISSLYGKTEEIKAFIDKMYR